MIYANLVCVAVNSFFLAVNICEGHPGWIKALNVVAVFFNGTAVALTLMQPA